MGRRHVSRRHVNPDILDAFIAENGFDSRWAFALYCDIPWRTFRRMVDECSAPVTVCFAIASRFGASFERVFGPDESDEMTLWKLCFSG